MKVNVCLKKIACLLMAVAITSGLAQAASAQTVLVDFGGDNSFRGVNVPSPDANGHFWNSLTPGPFFPGLKDINNNPTAVALGFSTPVGTDSFNGPAGV